MNAKIKMVADKNLNSTKKIAKALERENSLTLNVLIDLLSRGKNQKDSCERLNINYKLFRYYLDRNNKETISIKKRLNRASDYYKIRRHENLIRRELSKISVS